MGSQMSPQMTRLKGCIIRLVAFLQCEFSNVSSNDLLEKRHSHIGYICLIFLHCAFSNVFSNHLPEAKSHWIHLLDFSPLCIFKCFLKLDALSDL